ncbi:nitrate- and nitrite sensing domain-containing protein [Streptomyces sp. 7-21]|nr:nitrate- and nitrite sensing domain-containing protein [Streptomyces sp. 7-21]
MASSPEDPGKRRTDVRGGSAPPSSGTASASGALWPDPAPRRRFGGRFSPQNWRVATKLNAILLIPVLVALVLAGFRVADSYQTTRQARDAESIAELVLASTAYAHALIDERDVSARPLLEGRTDARVIEEARNATDQAREEFWQAAEQAPESDSLTRRLTAVAEAEPGLALLRQNAYTDRLPGVETEEGYVRLQHPLMAIANELGMGTEHATSYGRTVYAVSLAKSASSLQRSIGTHLLVAPGPGPVASQTQLTAFNSYSYLENVAREEYTSAATPREGQLLTEALSQAGEDAARQIPEAPSLRDMVTRIASGASAEELEERGITADTWFTAATAEFNAYQRLEQQLVDAAAADIREVAADAQRDMIVNSVFVLAALLLAFVVAGLMARAMSHDMRRLRGAAFEVAEQRLPAMVDQLSRTDPGVVDTRVAPIPIHSRDEIGEVARAFDQVHREAVRLAAEQALLRGNVNAIFSNLAGRNQSLIERQLALISELENNEADPEQLESLFRLDHLATRMRRNGENLLVLAGEEPGRRWHQPFALIDVLRAAASEVEAYERIEISGVPDCEIHGSVVNDLVHLLAELLENATTFSSPHTKVRVTATRLPDARVMIEIHDKGIGLTQEDFAEINNRLANPPAVDAEISRRMGLFVVGRLAERHGIRIQLRPSGEQQGTTALVMLPEAITHGGGDEAPPEEEFTVSRIVPEGPYTTEPEAQEPPRTAEELGFDDTRYTQSAAGDTVQLDPIGRSLLREERRAALGPRPGDEAAAPARPAGMAQQPGEPQETYQDPAPGQHQEGFQQPGFQQPGFQEPGYYEPLSPGQPAPQPGSSTAPAHAPCEEPGLAAQQPASASGFDAFAQQAGAHTESPHDGPMYGQQRVGFSGPDPAAAEYHSTTSAGLPRRERQRQRQRPEEEPAQRQREEPPAPPTREETPWDRGPRRDERHGGTTSAGLPRRVPRANLTEHHHPEPSAGGPQVSRNPEDVRGRLSSLRRGVEQGRGAGERRGSPNDER